MSILTEDFESPSDYSFSGTELVSGKAQIIDGRPTDATFFAPFTSSVDATWAEGSKVGANHGAVLSGGKIVFNGGPGTGRYVDWDGMDNVAGRQAGCFRLKVTPSYSGAAPSGTTQLFLMVCETDSSLNNLIQLFHQETGQLGVTAYDENGNSIFLATFGAWSPVSGTEYELELNYDFTNGSTKLFVDGVQLGAAVTDTLVRGSTTGLIRTGDNYIVDTLGAAFALSSLLIFSTVQHTSNYVVGPDPAEVPFTTGTVENLTEISAQAIQEFSADVLVSGSDTIKFGLYVNDELKWYNTVAVEWQDSDGSAAQLNSSATWTAPVLADLLEENSLIRLFVRLTSGDGSTTPAIDSASITFDFGGVAAPGPGLCLMSFYVKNSAGVPVSGAILKFSPVAKDDQYLEASSHLISPDAITGTTNAQGYGEVSLVRSSEFEGGSKQYKLTIAFPSGKKALYVTKKNPILVTVPDQDTADLATQISASET